MTRIKSLLFLLALAAQVPLASAKITCQVGGCLPKLTSFTTITQALQATPSPDVVEVCPGLYPEQVVIAAPVTIEGVPADNSSLVAIVPPSSGLAANVTSIFGYSVAAQVLVETGPVNITKILVSGGSASSWVAGIFYESGSFGTVNEVMTSGQAQGGEGVGIWAENGNPTMAAVSIEDSNISQVGFAGVWVGSNQTPPTLTATVKRNTVVGGSAGPQAAVFNYGGTGSIENNVLSDAGQIDIFDYLGSGLVMSGNTITNSDANGPADGIYLSGSDEVVKNNSASNNGRSGDVGIYLNTGGARVQGNTIAGNDDAIEFNCNTGTVSGNTINFAVTGSDQVPSGLTVTNTYREVQTFQTACDPATSRAKAKPAFLRKLLP